MIAKRSAGFLLLATMSGLLFYFALSEALATGVLLTAVLGVTLAALLYGFRLEAAVLRAPSSGPVFPTKDLYLFTAVFAGAIASYWLNVSMKLGAVVAAALVGLLSAVLMPAYGVPLYCGAFVGMASPKVLTGPQLALAAAIAGVIYVLAQDVFNGFGGKLGTIACAGCCLAAVFSGKALLSANVATWDVGQRIILTSVVSSILAYWVNVKMGKGPVVGSAVVGLVGGLVLPALIPEIGATLATVAICASFAGMSSKARISNEAYMALAGIIVGLVFMYSSPYLGGAGGKLGTTAFGSVIAVNALQVAVRRLTGKRA